MTSRTCLAAALVLLLPALARSQATLRGQIRNAQDLSPLPFATVFLANTTRGATTDDQGRFVLANVPVGKSDLVVSYVGFHPFKLTIQTDEAKFYRIGLQPDAEQLAEVTVRARRPPDKSWASNLAFFTQHFIGRSDNASQCVIQNPKVLFFRKTDEELVARTSEPLVIENRGLGYRLKYVLREFRYVYAEDRVQYDGDAVFEPLKGTARDQQRWAENRRRAYHGSLMHFMRALHRGNLTGEGFTVVPVTEQKNRDGTQKLVGLPGDTLVTVKALRGDYDVPMPTVKVKRLLDTLRSTPAHPVVAFAGPMQVTYAREPESIGYQKTLPLAEHGHRVRPQTTLLRMTKPEVTVEPDGRFYDPHGIRSQGYWSWELIAEELPFDYEP